MIANEKYLNKVKHINKWYDGYVATFTIPAKFGHLFEKHLNMSDEYLKKRCKREKVNASTLIGSTDEVMTFIRETLLINRDEIIEYLADDSDDGNWTIYTSMPEYIKGKRYLCSLEHDWKKGALECSEILIIIQKFPTKLNNGFAIETVFSL